MRLLSYQGEAGTEHLAVGLSDDSVADVSDLLGDPGWTMDRFLEDVSGGLARIRSAVGDAGRAARPIAGLRLLPPAPRPGKIVAVGRNYREHAAEEAAALPGEPLLFAKLPGALVGDGATVSWSAGLTAQVDYEAELAVVIARRARNVSEGEALDYVLGYSCLNDVSARDLQVRDGQWTRAKGLDTFCPMGPWLVTTDEVPDPAALRVRCRVNGEVRQDATTAELVHGVGRAHRVLLALVHPGTGRRHRDRNARWGRSISRPAGVPCGWGRRRGGDRRDRHPAQSVPRDDVTVPTTTRRVQLAYGTDGLTIDVPSGATVVTPAHRPAVTDEVAAVRAALQDPVAGRPLRDLVPRGSRVAISVCDVTRPQPRVPMLAAIAQELADLVQPEDVVVLIATGTHTVSTETQRREMLGDDVLARWRVVDHDARDRASLRDLGVVDGVPVRLNREWVEADVRITTGFVEPHFFAGFSGGPKMVVPGLAGLDTVLELHSPTRIADPRATFAVIDGNPVHDAVRAIAAATGVTFSVDVLIDDRHRITHAFGGPVLQMHAVACQTARDVAMQRVDGPFDIVITTNSGYPLDRNLYQSVKGMAAAATVLADGGTIICAAECRDGLPDDGPYARLLHRAPSIEAAAQRLLDADHTIPDGWQVQVQARVQARARVLLYSGLSASAVRAAHLEPIDDVNATLAELLERQPHSRVCVLPEGPQTIPYLDS